MPRLTWGQRYSTDFEKLVIEFLNQQLGVSRNDFVITSATGDGGYDAIRELWEINSPYLRLRNLTLAEAKLRTSVTHPIELAVVAKSFLVAFLTAANALVVFTNCEFGRDALRGRLRFQRKSNIQVRFVDGPTLSRWVRSRYDELAKTFAKGFLNGLLWSAESEKTAPYEVTEGGTYKIQQGVVSVSRPMRYRYARVSDALDTTLDPVAVEKPKTTDPAHPPSRALVEGRQEIVDAVVAALSLPGVTVIGGPAGVGKSVVADYVVAKLAEEGHSPVIVDLQQIISDHVLFVRLLSAITDIDILEVARETLSSDPDAVPDFLSFAGRDLTSSRQREHVAAILREGLGANAPRDIDTAMVLDYLASVVECASVKPILFFTFCDRATPQVFNATAWISERIAKAGATVVFELRDMGDAVPAIASPEEWMSFVRRVRNNATLGVFTVSPLSPKAAQQFVEQRLPHVGAERAKFIVERIGTLPLFLEYSIHALLHEKILVGTEAVVIEKLERFFEGISPANVTAILDKHIASWWAEKRTFVEYSNVITGAAFLSGHLDRHALHLLCPGLTSDDAAAALVDTRLFEYNGGSHNDVRTAHSLMLERIAAKVRSDPFRQETVATLLFSHVDELFSDPIETRVKRPELLFAMGLHRQAHAEAREAARVLATRRQWGMTSRMEDLAFRALQHFPADPGEIIDTVLDLLTAEDERYRLALPENEQRLQFASSIIHTAEVASESDLTRRMLKLSLLKWRLEFTQEHFEESMAVATEMRALAGVFRGVDEDLPAIAYGYYGITLKATGDRAGSLEWFDEAVKLFPNVQSLRDQRESNIAAYYLTRDLSRAREAIQKILMPGHPEDGYDLAMLHAQVDLAMIEFLDRRYEAATVAAQQAIAIAVRHDIPAQEARGRNILGCALWASGEVKRADREFDLACFAAERMLSNRFLWRMRTNRAGAALDCGVPEVAIEYARSAERLILAPRQRELAAFDSPMARHARWYIALIAIGVCYEGASPDDLVRMVETAKIPRLISDIKASAIGSFPPDLFYGTAHIHNGRIMITG